MLSLRFFLLTCSFCKSFCNPEVSKITEPVDHAESPTWDTRNGILYFVNFHEGQIYRYNITNEEIQWIKLDEGELAPVIPSKSNPNLLVVGLNRSVAAVEWDGSSPPSDTRILTTVSQQYPASIFNDGKADSEGRLWIGTKGGDGAPNEGVLYQITCKNLNSPKVKIAPVNISNGIAWNKANDRFFYIDTPTRQVVRYSFNSINGEISDPKVIFDVSTHDMITGNPKGMTIDEDDNLWVALYGGGAVVKVNSSSGDLLQVVAIPAKYVTSAMWGGPNLDILFVTTSRYDLSKKERRQQPAAGSVFAVRGLDTKGLPVFEVDLLKAIDDKECGAQRYVKSLSYPGTHHE